MDDLKIDYLVESKHKHSLSILYWMQMNQIIPTRIGKDSKTVTDYTFSNINNECKLAIIDSALSDHRPQLLLHLKETVQILHNTKLNKYEFSYRLQEIANLSWNGPDSLHNEIIRLFLDSTDLKTFKIVFVKIVHHSLMDISTTFCSIKA